MPKSFAAPAELRAVLMCFLVICALPNATRCQDCQSQCSQRCAGYSEGTTEKRNCLNNCLYFDCPKQSGGNQWGAIAYSVPDKRAGWAYGQGNKSAAETTALRYCREEGGRACQLVTSFSNGLCGAVAADGELWGWGTAGTQNAAQQRSLRECANQGGRNCSVQAWVCSSQARSSSNAEPARPSKAMAWGAIAYSSRDSGAGWAQGKDDRAAAEREAMAKCQVRGHSCVVRATFNKLCGALAVDGAATGVASAPDLNQAQRQAIEQCRTAGGARCAPLIGFCSF